LFLDTVKAFSPSTSSVGCLTSPPLELRKLLVQSFSFQRRSCYFPDFFLSFTFERKLYYPPIVVLLLIPLSCNIFLPRLHYFQELLACSRFLFVHDSSTPPLYSLVFPRRQLSAFPSCPSWDTFPFQIQSLLDPNLSLTSSFFSEDMTRVFPSPDPFDYAPILSSCPFFSTVQI